MSEFLEFKEEKNKIDRYFAEGYEVNSITENLSGTLIEFASSKLDGKDTIQLLLITPEARKYIATRLIYS
nr:hypothetical protein [Lysinibacillus timonensis]